MGVNPGSTKLITELLVLAGWVGASLLFVAVVAPAAFATLPSRTLAGALVGRVLPVLFLAGIAIGVLVVILEIMETHDLFARRRAVAAGLLAAACVFSHFVVGSRIARLRESLPVELEALPPGDAQRAMFGKLHALSVAGLGIGGIAAIAAIVYTVLALRHRA